MFVKYTYPISSDIFLPDAWPITWDRYRVTWTVNEGKAESITVSVQTSDLSGLPRIEERSQPGPVANIRIGHQPYQDEVESILRTACGLLGFFTDADIDFERPAIAWEPETPEEREQLHMFSFNIKPGARPEPWAINFDLIARCFLAAVPASQMEIPLSFLSKARRDLYAGRYIDAFYSYFFFLETQFAPGFSDPKKVSMKFKASKEIAGAFEEARKLAGPEVGRVRRLSQLLKESDEKLIDHLVGTRGKLHHHALPRKAGSWHPEKHGDFEAECRFLMYLTHVVSQRQNMDALFDDKITQQLKESTQREGIGFTYLVEAEGGGDRHGLNGLPTLRISMPARSFSYGGVSAVDDELRAEKAPYNGMVVRSYSIKSSDGSQVFASYRNYTFRQPDG